MPLYEYHCSACGHRFERIVKFSDAPLTTCPHCGKEALDQLISAPAVQFKGSGWYVTDYARKSSPASSSSASATASKDGGSAASSTSSAPVSTEKPANTGAAPGSAAGGNSSSSTKSGDSTSKGSK